MIISPFAALAIDIILALLLIGGMAACIIVYRRLDTIRQGQSEMAHLVASLNNAVLDAQRSIAELKHVAANVDQKLQSDMVKARQISDELSLIAEAGNNLADRIEKGLTASSHSGSKSSQSGGDWSGLESSGHRGVSDEARKAEAERQKALMSALKQAR